MGDKGQAAGRIRRAVRPPILNICGPNKTWQHALQSPLTSGRNVVLGMQSGLGWRWGGEY